MRASSAPSSVLPNIYDQGRTFSTLMPIIFVALRAVIAASASSTDDNKAEPTRLASVGVVHGRCFLNVDNDMLICRALTYLTKPGAPFPMCWSRILCACVGCDQSWKCRGLANFRWDRPGVGTICQQVELSLRLCSFLLSPNPPPVPMVPSISDVPSSRIIQAFLCTSFPVPDAEYTW